jgi:hypothetical protein
MFPSDKLINEMVGDAMKTETAKSTKLQPNALQIKLSQITVHAGNAIWCPTCIPSISVKSLHSLVDVFFFHPRNTLNSGHLNRHEGPSTMFKSSTKLM